MGIDDLDKLALLTTCFNNLRSNSPADIVSPTQQRILKLINDTLNNLETTTNG